ncbi:MAG: hypothetical protein HY551_00470, partial [Elusimicrobia bacterium]|nr:hypothetical protein [Elusimicrobiota bacterium]
MSEVIAKAESSTFAYRKTPAAIMDMEAERGFAQALARAAAAACGSSRAKAIVVFTLTGWSARVMAKHRPPIPIYALTPNRRILHQMSLEWGIVPILCPLAQSTDPMIARGERIVVARGLLKRGDVAIVLAGGTAKHRAANMIKILTIGE